MSGGPLFDQMGHAPRNSAAADTKDLAAFVDFDVQPRRVVIHRHRHARVWHCLERFKLCFPELGAWSDVRVWIRLVVFERRDLHEVERHFRLMKILAPVADHRAGVATPHGPLVPKLRTWLVQEQGAT